MKFLLLLIVLLSCIEGYSQNEKTKRKTPFVAEHDFFFGVGVSPLPAKSQSDFYSAWDNSLIHFEGDTYYGPKFTSGAYSLGYSYQLKHWLSVCISASYSTYWRNTYVYHTDRKLGKDQIHYLGIVPSFRLTWLNKNYIRMYTTLGVGVTLKWSRVLANSCGGMERLAAPEVAFLGVAVGKTYYGFMELGPSHRGVFNVGAGYRFNHTKVKK